MPRANFQLHFLPEGETERLHTAMTTFYELRRRARRLPLHALAYAVLLEAGVTERLLQVPLTEPERRQEYGRVKTYMEQGTALGRLPVLRDLADAAVFAASDRTSAMTGAIVNLTCGSIMD